MSNKELSKVIVVAIAAIVGTYLIIRYFDYKSGRLRPIGESEDNNKLKIDAETININNYLSVDFENDYREFVSAQKSKLKKTFRNSYDEAKERLLTFKKYIEDRKGYKVFQSMQKVKEEVLYPMFAMLCDNSEFDINQQVNNGGGSSDFNFSYGSEDITIVEFKLARTLKDNFLKQVEIYKEDKNTRKGL